MYQAVPAQLGDAVRGPGRETDSGVDQEQAGGDQAEAIADDQHRSRRRTDARSQHAPDTDGEGDGEQAGDDEVEDLDPPSIAQTQLADAVAPQVESRAGDDLDRRHQDEERAGDQYTAKQPAGGRSGRQRDGFSAETSDLLDHRTTLTVAGRADAEPVLEPGSYRPGASSAAAREPPAGSPRAASPDRKSASLPGSRSSSIRTRATPETISRPPSSWMTVGN